MLYIHDSACISPQPGLIGLEAANLADPKEGKFLAAEPAYDAIPKGVLRRMSKPVRMGVGAAMPLLEQATNPDGIIIATANAGMEDCFYFLKQLIDYNEGLLTPGNFVQSTPQCAGRTIKHAAEKQGL